MPELPLHSNLSIKVRLSLNFPLRVRGIKRGYFHNSPYPSYLKRGFWKNFLRGEFFEKN